MFNQSDSVEGYTLCDTTEWWLETEEEPTVVHSFL